MEPPSCCPQSDTSAKGINSTELNHDGPAEQSSDVKLDSTDDTDRPQKPGSSPMNMDVDKVSGTSIDKSVTSSSADDATDSLDCGAKGSLPQPTDVIKENGLPGLSDAKKEKDENDSAGKSGVGDSRSAGGYKSTKVSRSNEASNHHNEESAAILLSKIEGNKLETESIQEDSSNNGEEHVHHTELHVNDSNSVQIKSGTDLDYDIEDPLELARLVAIEAKREVDCREQSCSSSDKLPGGEAPRPDSPDSECGAESRPQEDDSLKGSSSSAELDLSADSSSPGKEEEPGITSKSQDAVPGNGTAQEVGSSQVTEVAQENSANPEKGLCNFDLNMDVCSEDADHLDNNSMSMPVSVVSASRAAAVPGLPVSPLQFEGALGWKGTAATSAFRPASPCRIPEMDKAHSTGGSNSSSKRDGCLVIDLNANESLDERGMDHPLQEKQIPVLSGLPSGESSVDASPRRSERIELDLNQASEDGDARIDWRTDGLVFHQRNGYISHSPSSSSSSKQPSLRNIDLNDQPSLANESADHHPFLSRLSHQSFSANPSVKRTDDTVISIMGMKVEVNRKDFTNPHPQSLPFLKNFDPALDANMARNMGPLGMGPTIPYPHSASYGYNGGLTSGPALPFTPAMYGPGGSFPYMLDSRGAPVVPQVMGSASNVPPVFPQHPFFMSITGPGTSPANGTAPGPSRNSFDLNSGLTLDGGANRDIVGFRQFLNPGHHTFLMDDYMKSSNSQASTSSGSGVKRKEPDSGWEAFPFRHGNRM
ncbi:OLC1v1018275C1 [Oldenlandia corymbosa var. corymbosa]|uniref:OLC1v1018275C1 n=1 Tax=Oldenlandia corymbosa var. corymbosa TaxID=529605 RepID=A0AAV1EBK3_OLDCO|nr:OLC1v1018275C1 [Oldenlandia corymbosa var. corymbosa]